MKEMIGPVDGFRLTEAKEIDGNMIKRIGDEWMLISAKRPGTAYEYNMMTASWGQVGFLWNKPVFTCYVRPQRYTYEFTEASDIIALSFFDAAYKPALSWCGSHSGRGIDKGKEAGLTPRFDVDGAVFFDEASMVIVGRKLFSCRMKDEDFVDKSIVSSCYGAGDFHMAYTCEILGVFTK